MNKVLEVRQVQEIKYYILNRNIYFNNNKHNTKMYRIVNV